MQNFDFKRFGCRIRNFRKEKGWSIAKLSKEANLNKNTVRRIEKGQLAYPHSLWAICEALDIDALELANDELEEGVDYRVMRHRPEDLWEVREEDNLKMSDIGNLSHGSFRGTILEIASKTRDRAHEGEELLFCLEGSIRLRVANFDVVIKQHEAVLFRAGEVHSYENVRKDWPDEPSTALSVWSIDPKDSERSSEEIIVNEANDSG